LLKTTRFPLLQENFASPERTRRGAQGNASFDKSVDIYIAILIGKR
jgi:hypothetical protein